MVAYGQLVHLMQYSRGTVEMGITFSGGTADMHTFTDADWAGDLLTRRSTTGYVEFFCSGPIAWQSKLQTTVATSSMQAEYQAMYAGMKEVVWHRGVLAELGLQLIESDSKRIRCTTRDPSIPRSSTTG